MRIQLSERFTYGKLLRFTLPSIMMMMFTSAYGIVDGIFVSNFAGKTAFAAINLIWPYIMMFGTIGIMIGTGGTALVSATLGSGDRERANKAFSQLVYFMILSGVILTGIGIGLLRPVAVLMGAEGEMIGYCVQYGMLTLPAMTALILQNAFQSFCAAAEKPNLGLGLTLAAGITNIVLDWLFVGVLSFGLPGAAVATALSQCVGGFIPLIYFLRKNSSLLRLTRARIEAKVILKACTNGSSEMMSNLSLSLVNMLYNAQLMKYAGENGVAAYGVIMYVSFLFISVFLGYSMGAAPIIGFKYGADNRPELKSVYRKSLVIIGVLSVALTAASELLSGVLSGVFVSYDPELLAMTHRAFVIYSPSFLFSGVSIFGSAHFTALNNGLISAAISFTRTLLFQCGAVLLLPLIFDLDGIWYSILVAEFVSALLTVICFAVFRKKYHYA